ncbi:MAG: hypothetical protein LM576_05070 [Thermofilum sp.]|nr:hypothetical protein [Thermofilum sp.]
MRSLLWAALFLLATLALLASAQPSVTALEPEAEVLGLAVSGNHLAAVYANGTLATYELPLLTPVCSARWNLGAVKPVGGGAVEGGLAVFVLSNGTVVAFNPASCSVAWKAELPGGRLERAVVGGRWVVAVAKYGYSTEKGSLELDRVLVYDVVLKALTFKVDRNSDIRLVYAFDVKVSGNLLLLVGIDTTCEICRLTDTYVVVYNLSTFERVFAERIGECKADLRGSALLAARVEDGTGFMSNLLTGARWEFKVGSRIADARVSGGEGYVLAQQPEGGVALYRIRGQGLVKAGVYPEGYAIAFLNGTPLIVGAASVYVGGQRLNPLGWSPPWKPSEIVEYGKGVLVQYGRWLLLNAYAAAHSQPQSAATLVVVTEAGATVRVSPAGVSVVANETGMATLTLPPGAYEVSAWKEGFSPNSTRLALSAGERRFLELKLAPARPKQEAYFSVVFKGASGENLGNATLEVVSANGSLIYSGSLNAAGRGAPVKLALPAPGTYVVRVRADGCSWVSGPLPLLPGEEKGVEVECVEARQPSEAPAGNSSSAAVNAREIAAALASYVAVNATRARSVVTNLPPVTDIDGASVELAKGVKLLVFFYTKCTGCSFLVPKLRALSVEVVMISPSSYDSEASLRSYSEKVNASGWRWVLDEGAQLTARFNVSAFPTVVLLEDGAVVFVGVGAAEEAQQLASTATSLLAALADWVEDPVFLALTLGAILSILVSGRVARE